MSDEQVPAGYQITRETDSGKETEPHCVTCVERDGLLVWDHEPIFEEEAEDHKIVCDVCGQMLFVDLNAALNIRGLGLQTLGLSVEAPAFMRGE